MGMRAHYLQLDSEDIDLVLKDRGAPGEMLMGDITGGVNMQDVFKTLGMKDSDLKALEKVVGPLPSSMKGSSKESGYFRAKQKQEELINEGKIPYTIVQATQFFEFVGGIADAGAQGSEVHLSTAQFQPIAADDVAEVMAEIAISKPLNGTLEIGGSEKGRMCDLVSQFMKANNDNRKVVEDAEAKYFGIRLQERSLVTEDNARRTPTKYSEWLQSVKSAATV